MGSWAMGSGPDAVGGRPSPVGPPPTWAAVRAALYPFPGGGVTGDELSYLS
jgi:hypothetical protein